MSALSPLVSHDQDALQCPADIYRQLRDEGVRYAPEIFSIDEVDELIFRREIDAAETEVAEGAVFLCPAQAIALTQ